MKKTQLLPVRPELLLTPKEVAYLERRMRLIRAWPWMGGVMLGVLALGAGWLWLNLPQMVNPWWVFDRIQSGELPVSSLTLMAAMLPVLVLLCLLLLIALMLFVFAALRNEHRLMRFMLRSASRGEA